MALPDDFQFPKNPAERQAMQRMITDLAGKVGRLEGQVEGQSSRLDVLEHTVNGIDAKMDRMLIQSEHLRGGQSMLRQIGVVGWAVITAAVFGLWTIATRLNWIPGGVK